MQDDTAAYICSSHDVGKYGELLPRTWIKHSRNKVKCLIVQNLVPSHGLQYYYSAVKASIFNILNKYCGEAFAKSMEDNPSWGTFTAPQLNVPELRI